MFEKNPIELPNDIFRLIRDYIRDYCGMFFDDKSKHTLERRLNRRLNIHHIKDFREYYRLLMYDKDRDKELQIIMDILTVNETYFFREESQLKTLHKEILPEIKKKNRGIKKINMWSAGCSTGEEPYSIAMIVLENKEFDDWEVNIIGSDISQRVLSVAREGIYKKNSFRNAEYYYIRKYFKEQQNGDRKISDRAKNLVNFNCLNLLDPFKIKLIGKLDVIFCRNVLIYFDKDSRKKVIESFFNMLSDGGYLILGHTESLINVSTAFTLKHLKNDLVYQKPLKKPDSAPFIKLFNNDDKK